MGRTQAAVDTSARIRKKDMAPGYKEEKEVILMAGVDPEAVTKVMVDDIEVKALTREIEDQFTMIDTPKILVRRVARRVDFDRVELRTTKISGERENLQKVTLYKIHPDGTFKIISQKTADQK